MTKSNSRRVLLTGGAGYVGTVLVPKLLRAGHHVRVLDLFMYGEDVLADLEGNPRLELWKGDIRYRETVEAAVQGCDTVIHLACISNDPSFELDPTLGRSINFEAFAPLVDAAIDAGVRRFVYASSSSVYGIKEEDNVSEELPLLPLTDYSRFKAMCEDVLLAKRRPGFETLIVRPATVCGYSPRLRLDLSVNILTHHAVMNGVIKVFGGAQRRPNIHIEDMTDLYVATLEWPSEKVDGAVYNVGYQNQRIMDIAEIVRSIVGEQVKIVTSPTDDNRSYHISSEKLRRELGFTAARTIEDAVVDLVSAFRSGKVPNSTTDDRYYNIRTLKQWIAKEAACAKKAS